MGSCSSSEYDEILKHGSASEIVHLAVINGVFVQSKADSINHKAERIAPERVGYISMALAMHRQFV